MTRTVVLLFFAAVASCSSTGSWPAEPRAAATQAEWKPGGFARASEGCTQEWTCDVSGCPPRAGCHVEEVKGVSTSGVCVADGGPAGGCARCMALPPATPCACRYVCP